MEKNVVAILSTTILPLDGIYKVETIESLDMVSIEGVANFIGHPTTKTIVEARGAVQAPSKLFTGLRVGETALCLALIKPRAEKDWTEVNQEATLDDLSIRLLTRVK